DGLEILERDPTAEARLERALLGLHVAHATDVERAHRELRARPADRLRGDDAHRLADVDEVAAGQIAPVAPRTDAAQRLAGEDRADLHLLDAGLFHPAHARLVEDVALVADHLVGAGHVDVLERRATQQ